MSKRKTAGADSSGASQPAAPGAKQSRASSSAAAEEPRLEVCRRASVTHMVCATLGCGRQTASSRASFCRQCFLESARTNSLKRQSFRGGGGVVGNKGNTTAGQSKVNAVEKRKTFKGNTETGQSKRSAGKRSGLKRSAKHALVVKKRWLDKILDGEKDWGSDLRERGIEGGRSLPRARLLASCSAALDWWIVSNFRQTASRHMLTDTASPHGPASHTRGPSLGCSSKRSVSRNRSLMHIGLAQWCG